MLLAVTLLSRTIVRVIVAEPPTSMPPAKARISASLGSVLESRRCCR